MPEFQLYNKYVDTLDQFLTMKVRLIKDCTLNDLKKVKESDGESESDGSYTCTCTLQNEI